MKLPFKPHVLALVCSTGILAASGVLYVKSRTPAEPPVPAPVAQATTPAPVTTPTYTTAQIDQWVAPVALYPDPLLSQVLMASTYPSSVVQAVQWSQDHPTLQGDAAVQAVASQPWDASVKSLVAFPQLMGLMGENPQWVENLGNAFLAQPQDVMDSVQKLRALAQQTGSLKSTPQQKVTTTPKTVTASQSTGTSSSTHSSATTSSVIRIESADPQVVYVPNYNPSVVYGTWPNTTYPPVYLPPPPGEQFASSFVRGFGYSLGVATTYAIFSNIDWDDDHHHHDDDDHHHDDDHHDDGHHDDYHHDGGDYRHNGDNININVNNFNKITGQHINGQTMGWQHNPAYRGNVPYPNNRVAQQFHQTNTSGGLSTTHQANLPGGLSMQQPAQPNRDNQRQAAMAQLQQRTHNGGLSASGGTSRDAQRQAASQQLHQIAQRNNFRGYDTPAARPQTHNAHSALQSHTPLSASQRQTLSHHSTLNQTQRQALQQHTTLNQTQRQTLQQHSGDFSQRNEIQTRLNNFHNNALSGNDSRAPSWQAQQSRGLESRQLSGLNTQQRDAARERLSEHHDFQFRRR